MNCGGATCDFAFLVLNFKSRSSPSAWPDTKVEQLLRRQTRDANHLGVACNLSGTQHITNQLVASSREPPCEPAARGNASRYTFSSLMGNKSTTTWPIMHHRTASGPQWTTNPRAAAATTRTPSSHHVPVSASCCTPSRHASPALNVFLCPLTLPYQAATSFECDGCGHHASFHSLENLSEDAILKKWSEEEASNPPTTGGATKKRRRIADKPNEGVQVLELTEDDPDVAAAFATQARTSRKPRATAKASASAG